MLIVDKFCGFALHHGQRRENPRYNSFMLEKAIFFFDTGISPRLFA
jgi:hypothetical protein